MKTFLFTIQLFFLSSLTCMAAAQSGSDGYMPDEGAVIHDAVFIHTSLPGAASFESLVGSNISNLLAVILKDHIPQENVRKNRAAPGWISSVPSPLTKEFS